MSAEPPKDDNIPAAAAEQSHPPNPVGASETAESSAHQRRPGDGEETVKPTGPIASRFGAAVGSVAPTPQAKWQADQVCVEQIVSMGFSKSVAEKGLFHTGNSSADLAVLWILDHPESQLESNLEDELLGDFESGSSSESEEFADPEKLKMVLVVNNELKMGKGKMIAQGAHATLGLYRAMLERPEMNDMLVRWDMAGSMKVAVKGDSTDHLMVLYEKAHRDLALPCYLVRDAGRTQIPAGSVTVLAVFGPTNMVNQVTGHLKLM